MSNTVLFHPAQPLLPGTPVTKRIVASVLAGWFALVLVLGIEGAFSRPPGTPPFPIFVGVMAPILAFLLAYRASPAFRDFVLALDLRVLTAIQAWRFAGLGFLALYAHGVLPGFFAWPAGLGDIAIGVTAPWLVLTLIRRPDFAAGRPFLAWHLLGMLDLIVAIGTGTISTIFTTGAAGEATTGPMALMPLVLIPAYFVPLFAMLHLAAVFQTRTFAASAHPG